MNYEDKNLLPCAVCIGAFGLIFSGMVSAAYEDAVAGQAIEDVSGRPTYGQAAGTIEDGYLTGGLYNSTIGNDVYIYTVGVDNGGKSHNHGIYSNGNGSSTAGNGLKIDNENKDGDGLRTNPGDRENAQNARGHFEIGDDLTIWVRGASGDCVNLNGFSTVNIGDNARFFAWGFKASLLTEGSHGLRANFGSKLTVGKNAYVETVGESSHGVYVVAGGFTNNTYDSAVTLGDGAQVVTKGGSSHGISLTNKLGVVTMLGSSSISTEGSKSHAVNLTAAEGKTLFQGDAALSTQADGSHGLYMTGSSGSGAQAVFEKDVEIETTGAGSHGIYTYLYSGAVTSEVHLENGQKTSIKTTGAGSHAIYTNAAGGKVLLGSAETILRNESNTDSYAIYSAKGSVQGDSKFTITNAAKDAGIYVSANGMVALGMRDGSVFEGYTQMADIASGELRLGLAGGAHWTLSQDSQLTALTADASSMITFSLTGQNTCTDIMAHVAMNLGFGSVMDIVLSGYNPVEGDEFKLVGVSEGGTFTANGVRFDYTNAVLSEGLYWDSSTFHQDGTIRVGSIASLPEPATATLGMIGFGMILIRRRRAAR